MNNKVEENEGKNMATKNLSLLESLPTEILVLIFKKSSQAELGRLCQTSTRLNRVVNDLIRPEKSRILIATNQLHTDIIKRSSILLSGMEKCRISKNWVEGAFSEKLYHPFRNKCMPWLFLDSEYLWVSKEKGIITFSRKQNNLRKRFILRGNEDDVCRFICDGDLVVSGGRDRSICCWEKNSGVLKFRHEDSHNADVVTVDMFGSSIVSGSHDETIKVWSITEQETLHEKSVILIGDRVWALGLQSQTGLCCVGSAGCNKILPLQVFDLNRCCVAVKLNHRHLRNGAGVLAINWETPQEILSGGYDTYLRLWDIRTGRAEKIWEDPYDSAIYCISSDNKFTILTGLNLHGRCQLWDKRCYRTVQTYFLNTYRSTPIYSLAFDPSRLFAVAEKSLHIVDFSILRKT